MTADPTGARYRLAEGNVTAEVSQVGAALRALTVGGVDLVPRYPDDAVTPAASGIVLVPWPNRIRDGKWSDDGEERQLAITEPKFGNASHGLLRFTPYRLVEQGTDAVTLAADVVPQTGYPYHLDTRVTYRLTADGIHVTHTIVNVGAGHAPVALGTHPYFQIGDVDTADLSLQAAAETWFRLDDQNIPIAEEPVDAQRDLHELRRVGGLSLDGAFAGLPRDAAGHATAALVAPDGRRLTVWLGDGFDYLQLFITDRYPGHDVAVAIEPMTAPANAFNTGQGLRRLAPGERWDLEWGVRFER
ncbi:aldose 1-epimerase family protein [Microbacterium dauci]|uniref:Aldose 1-epimerase family protein n=1 Tax=Microbacterium dauci TaxID=3048008 RepID=A0ABT6ZDZ5_9MICO|nr:aldose 1-epimerase family protein [Microbacterium sp. LX3-4]MDJ1113925.1 aldose 1-epimerase family protein [Microbacterium sp. LX3-4]